ncbi:uncharacterized protein LOC130257484 [Oenanthe melanoleuca]|uniref:uncharacterized protein LOC130257484 n=1 Tax=Oenanthe melanoleuca TaxID=2939378 RepID=UPI0024C15BE1|nr:uncharacterized protein LOC130257484 [Oenanthe melanoleuca]
MARPRAGGAHRPRRAPAAATRAGRGWGEGLPRVGGALAARSRPAARGRAAGGAGARRAGRRSGPAAAPQGTIERARLRLLRDSDNSREKDREKHRDRIKPEPRVTLTLWREQRFLCPDLRAGEAAAAAQVQLGQRHRRANPGSSFCWEARRDKGSREGLLPGRSRALIAEPPEREAREDGPGRDAGFPLPTQSRNKSSDGGSGRVSQAAPTLWRSPAPFPRGVSRAVSAGSARRDRGAAAAERSAACRVCVPSSIRCPNEVMTPLLLKGCSRE